MKCPHCDGVGNLSGWPEAIRQARRDLGVSQAAFAREIGISKTHLSLIETGNRAPTPLLKQHISDELGVEAVWVGEDGGV